MNEVMVGKVQLSLQDPLTFSSPEEPSGEVCLLPLDLSGQTGFVPKCHANWKWLILSSHCLLFHGFFFFFK